jgi:hypothetical protein
MAGTRWCRPCRDIVFGRRTTTPRAKPSTFVVNGKRYIAVMSGWNGDARGVQARLNRLRPGEFPEVPDGGSLWVFSLP